MNARILIADDERNIRESVSLILSEEGYETRLASTGKEAMDLLNQEDFDILITDLKMPEMDGMELVKNCLNICPQTSVIIITAHASVESAIEALRMGAFDYILKPFDFDDLLLKVKRLLDHKELALENQALRQEVEEKYNFSNIIGQSPEMQDVFHLIKKVSSTKGNVLITGKSGTGKELVARAIHFNSPRSNKRFVAINCGSIPKELMGSELFGHEEGAFTGARKKGQAGKFELANGGTLLLDEISEMPMESQTYLLRVIEDMTLTRLGGTKQVPIDVRIIATTNKDLDKMAKEGLFRADLFYRLNVLSVDLPSLKERKEDIPLLADHFREVLSKALSKTVTDISPSALEALIAYDWPGNIRELRNALERAMVICPGETIAWKDLPEQIRIGGPIPDHLTEKERERYLHFLRSYRESGGNITRVAKMLNVSRPTVYAWRKKLGLN